MSIVKLMAHTSFAGTGASVTVGGTVFPIPTDTRVHHVGDVCAYVLDEHHGGLYCFTAAGQVDVPDDLAALLVKRYFETYSTS